MPIDVENARKIINTFPWTAVLNRPPEHSQMVALFYIEILHKAYCDCETKWKTEIGKTNINRFELALTVFCGNFLDEIVEELDTFTIRYILCDATGPSRLIEDIVNAYLKENVSTGPKQSYIDFVERRCRYFFDNLFKAIDRINKDWKDIVSVMAVPDMVVAKIASSGSDSHKQGARVLFITFEGQHLGKTILKKIVYKPSSVEVDYLIFGNKTALDRAESTNYQRKNVTPLAEDLNRFIKKTKGADAKTIPTYTVLPRSVQINGQIEEYGYVEFIDYPEEYKQVLSSPNMTECLEQTEMRSLNIDMDKKLFAQMSDCYYVFGMLTALACTISLKDTHAENIIMSHLNDKLDKKIRPYFIDCEATLIGNCERLSDTCLLMDSSEQVAGITGYMGTPKQRFYVKTDGTILPIRHSDPTINRIWINSDGTVGPVQVDWGQIMSGFEIMCMILREYFRTEHDNIVNWITGIEKIALRFVPISTTTWITFCEQVIFSALSNKQYTTQNARTIFEAAYDQQKNALNGDQNFHTYKKWAVTDIMNGDIPAFYHFFLTDAAYSSTGELMTLTQKIDTTKQLDLITNNFRWQDERFNRFYNELRAWARLPLPPKTLCSPDNCILI